MPNLKLEIVLHNEFQVRDTSKMLDILPYANLKRDEIYT